MKTIRLILFIAFTCLSLFSCSNWSNKKEEVAGELIQGELYFKLIDFPLNDFDGESRTEVGLDAGADELH